MYFTLTASQLHPFWNPFSSFIGPGTISQVCAKNIVMTLILWHNPVIWGGWNTSVQLFIASGAAQRHRSCCRMTWKKKTKKQPFVEHPRGIIRRNSSRFLINNHLCTSRPSCQGCAGVCQLSLQHQLQQTLFFFFSNHHRAPTAEGMELCRGLLISPEWR